MPSCLVHTGDESVTLSAATVKRLLDRGDGDAALLYLALLRRQGTVPPRSLAGELRWDRGRIEAAETALRELGLVAPAETPPAPAEERPVYQRADVAERLEHSKAFQALTRQVEVKLGKKLTTPDVGILLGLTDYLGLPEGVVYLLVCHCVERVQRRFGEGRRPGMKQIEKEGYAWARMGIDTQAAADAYLRTYAQRQGVLPQYMKALQLGDRPPAPSEEKYILAWQEMGFGPEAVALAYDKTVLKCHELKWAYCNGRVCRCLRGYYAREQQKELSRMLDLGHQSFDTFSTDWYPDRYDPNIGVTVRQHMEMIYDICADFAHQFGKRPANLLLFGAPGLGKTHLSAAIAREVSEKGHSVVYDTAGHIFAQFEQQKFTREEEADDHVERVLNCDLLILDDLGSEMTTSFVQSALYQIVNTRQMERRSTIISTNLTPGELARRYTPQIASRIEGEYTLLPFAGEDIRKLKKERARGN